MVKIAASAKAFHGKQRESSSSSTYTHTHTKRENTSKWLDGQMRIPNIIQ